MVPSPLLCNDWQCSSPKWIPASVLLPFLVLSGVSRGRRGGPSQQSRGQATLVLNQHIPTNSVTAAGSPWQRLFAIPMGGSFSAQAADLYCIWAFHLLKARSRQWGKLSTSPEGYPVWTSSTGRIMALAQFRDNILIASAGPRATSVVRDVCNTLTNAWNYNIRSTRNNARQSPVGRAEGDCRGMATQEPHVDPCGATQKQCTPGVYKR